MTVGRVSLLLLGLVVLSVTAVLLLNYVEIVMTSGAWASLTGCLFVVFIIQSGIVAYGTVSSVRDPSSFMATLPMTNPERSRAILKTIAASVAITVPIAHFQFNKLIPQPLSQAWNQALYDSGIRLSTLWVATVLMICIQGLLLWTLLGLAWPIKDFARRRFGTPLTFAGLMVTFIVVIAAANRFGREIVIFLGLSALAWKTVTFVQSYRQGLISRGVIFVSVFLWLLLCSVMAVACLASQTNSIAIIVLYIGLLALPLAPLAAVPLVLQRSRHR